MNRITVLQSILNTKPFPRRYLEIGVFDGECFFAITGALKTAVDPQFNFASSRIVKSYLKRPSNVFNRYYQVPSDQYFAAHSAQYDVVFVDGLHTYEQSLKDVENALVRLRDGGVVVMHDCCPTSRSMAIPAASFEAAAKQATINDEWTGAWTGDVWKAVCHLRATRTDLNVCVLDCDYGLGIVTRGPAASMLDVSVEQIRDAEYDDLDSNRVSWLNLKDPSYLQEILSSL